MRQQALGPSPSPGRRRSEIRLGSWVDVLTASEILRTLDADQLLGGLPFMPEMLAFCGHRYRVALRAERTCVHRLEFPFRKLEGSVILEGLRCDGSLHGGCQLGCMFFWKEEWLRKVPRGQPVQTNEDARAVRSTAEVRERVDRVIVEESGRLRHVRDTVILEGSICDRYFGCARGMPFLWREAWLSRVERGPATGNPPGGGPPPGSEP